MVDDEKELLELYRDFFSSSTLEIHTAENGLRALELIQSQAFDLVVTDINMPHLNGLQLIRCIKASEFNKAIPIIVISSHLNQDNLEKLEALKLVETLEKPVSPKIILQNIHQILGISLKENQRYNPKLIDLFQGSATKVLGDIVKGSIGESKPEPYETNDSFGYVTGTVSFFGAKFFGTMSVSCEEEFICSLAENLFETGHEEVNAEEFLGLANELVRQIGEQVLLNAKQIGFSSLLGSPFYSHGHNHKAPALLKQPTLYMNFQTSFGSCRVGFLLGNPAHLDSTNQKSAPEIFLHDEEKKAS